MEGPITDNILQHFYGTTEKSRMIKILELYQNIPLINTHTNLTLLTIY